MGYKNSKLTENDILDIITGNKEESKKFIQQMSLSEE